MPEITTEIYLICAACGSDLDATYDARNNEISVSACDKCVEETYNEGYDKGHNEAEEAG